MQDTWAQKIDNPHKKQNEMEDSEQVNANNLVELEMQDTFAQTTWQSAQKTKQNQGYRTSERKWPSIIRDAGHMSANNSTIHTEDKKIKDAEQVNANNPIEPGM